MIINPKAEQIKKAAALIRKKERIKQGKFLVEGAHAVAELLDSDFDTAVIYITQESRAAHPAIDRAADAKSVRIEVITPAVAQALSDTVTPQGIVAVAAAPEPTNLAHMLERSRLVVVLNDVRDPGNAGTVLRIADAAGADTVVFTGQSIDPYHPKVVRATTGSLFHIPVIVEPNVFEVLAAVDSAGIITIATDLGGSDLNTADPLLKKPLCWVFGNEAQGLPRNVIDACQISRKLPLYGRAESLNLAAAAAVCVYTSAFAQRESAS